MSIWSCHVTIYGFMMLPAWNLCLSFCMFALLLPIAIKSYLNTRILALGHLSRAGRLILICVILRPTRRLCMAIYYVFQLCWHLCFDPLWDFCLCNVALESVDAWH